MDDEDLDVLDTLARARECANPLASAMSTAEIAEDTGRRTRDVFAALRRLERAGVVLLAGRRARSGASSCLWRARFRCLRG